jgi:predicted ATPase
MHQFFVALSQYRPLLFILDDLHWADASTLGILGYLARQCLSNQRPIFFLTATRSVPPRSPLAVLVTTLSRQNYLERLLLNRLPEADVLALAQHLSPKQGQALAQWLIKNSEGNPFILVELIRYVQDPLQGIWLTEGALDFAALPSSPTVPEMVYTLIQARLMTLSESARRVLDAGVAMGRSFEFEVVARAAALSDEAALSALDELEQAKLISPLDDGLHYVFDHSLTMEVAYREVGEARHRILHRRVAEALEVVYRGRLGQVAGLLALHFSEGNAPQSAAQYALLAGQSAANLAAWQEAIAFYEQGLRLLEQDTPAYLQTLQALGTAQINAGQYAQASEVLYQALMLTNDQANPSAMHEISIALSEALLLQARYSEVVTLAEQMAFSNNPQALMGAEYMWGLALSQEGGGFSWGGTTFTASQGFSPGFK